MSAHAHLHGVTLRGGPLTATLCATFLSFLPHMPRKQKYQKSIESGQLDHHSASFCALIPKNTFPMPICMKNEKCIFSTHHYIFSKAKSHNRISRINSKTCPTVTSEHDFKITRTLNIKCFFLAMSRNKNIIKQCFQK